MTKAQVRTLADLARLAKVSKSTASRALNDSPLIGAETKDRIRALARQHNFQVNNPARQLTLKQSRTIAFVTHCYQKDFSVADLFGLEIMGGVSNGLHEAGYDMLEVHVDPRDTDWASQYLDSGRVDGFILMTSTRKQSHIKALLEIGAPFIVWGMPRPGSNFCSIMGDNLNGGRLATEHLVRTGRKRIAFLGGPEEDIEVGQRFKGYETVLREAGRNVDPELLAYGDYTLASGRAATRNLLQKAPDLDAIFVNSDLMAVAAMNAIREAGRRVPEDIGVVGYDDLSIAELSYPPLTTIRQHVPRAGRLLAQNLIHFLQTGMVTHVTIPIELIVRQSA